MATPRRPIRVLAALALVAGVSSACGSNRRATAGAPKAVPTGPARGASDDRALAAFVNLTAADLPGWTATPNSTTGSDKAMQARLAKCAGAPDPATVEVVDMGSPTFRSGRGDATAEVTSDVTTVRTSADGRRDLQAMQSDALAGCIQRVAVPYLRSRVQAGTTVSQVTVERLGAPSGVADSFSYRLVVPVSAAGQGTLTITSDTTGFLVGRVEVELNDTETGGVPDPALEQRLVALLYQRARQAAGT